MSESDSDTDTMGGTTSYTGTVFIPKITEHKGQFYIGNPPVYDGLPDTPLNEIAWEPMTALLEYFEDTKFSYNGRTWFATSSSTLIDGVWDYWFTAVPYMELSIHSPEAKAHKISNGGFKTLKAAQKAAIDNIRGMG